MSTVKKMYAFQFLFDLRIYLFQKFHLVSLRTNNEVIQYLYNYLKYFVNYYSNFYCYLVVRYTYDVMEQYLT